MKNLLWISILAVGTLMGCAHNDSSSSPAASTSSAFGTYCPTCTNGVTGGSVTTAQAMALDYSQTTRFDMQMQAYPTGQVAIAGVMTVLQPNSDTCGLPAGQYPFQMSTSFVSNLILGGGVLQGAPLQMYTSNSGIVLRPLSSGAYSAYMQIYTPACSNAPFTVNWPGT